MSYEIKVGAFKVNQPNGTQNDFDILIDTDFQDKLHQKVEEALAQIPDNYQELYDEVLAVKQKDIPLETGSGAHSVKGLDAMLASGPRAISVGKETSAAGEQSFAEGLETSAIGDNQHVEGKYNIIDEHDTYAHIIGNGTEEKRSNAFTIDWDGNMWIAGDIYFGGESYDDPKSKTLIEYVNAHHANQASIHVVNMNGTMTPAQFNDLDDGLYYVQNFIQQMHDNISCHGLCTKTGDYINNLDYGIFFGDFNGRNYTSYGAIDGFGYEEATSQLAEVDLSNINASGKQKIKNVAKEGLTSGAEWSTSDRLAALAQLGITVDNNGICHFSS